MTYLKQLLKELETTPRKTPIVAPSWLAKLLNGEIQCLFQYYVQAWYKVKPSSVNDFTLYQIKHESFLRERRQYWESRGYRISVEKQNLISFPTISGLQFIGEPDLYITDINHIEELKTGKPKNSDVIQLMLYMCAAYYAYGLHEIPSGEIRYRDGSCHFIDPEEITNEFREEVTKLNKLLASEEEPLPLPTKDNCQYCKLNQNCPVSAISEDNVA